MKQEYDLVTAFSLTGNQNLCDCLVIDRIKVKGTSVVKLVLIPFHTYRVWNIQFIAGVEYKANPLPVA